MQSSGRDEQSLRHIAVVENFWISTNHGPAIEAKKKNEKIDMQDFPVHDYIQEKNGSPYFSSMVGQCKPFQEQQLLRFRKFCYHGNLRSHLFSPLNSTCHWNRINDYFYFVGGNSWESWCNHFWTHGIHVI